MKMHEYEYEWIFYFYIEIEGSVPGKFLPEWYYNTEYSPSLHIHKYPPLHFNTHDPGSSMTGRVMEYKYICTLQYSKARKRKHSIPSCNF
jgi:hypothetical protein